MLVKGLRVEAGSVAHFPGLLGPMLAALLVTALVGGRKGLRALFSRMFWLGPNWVFKLQLSLSPLVGGVLACLLMFVMGQPIPPPEAFITVPGLPLNWPLALLAVIVVNGFGEEAGWRGFLTERLLITCRCWEHARCFMGLHGCLSVVANCGSRCRCSLTNRLSN